MDIWTVVRTVLEKNPEIKGGQLWQKVRARTGLSRSTIYEHLSSFALQGKIFREKGHYFLEKPERKSETSDFLRSLIPQFWKERREVQQLCSNGMLFKAYEKTLQFAGNLPLAHKKQLAQVINEIENRLAEIRNKRIKMEFFGKQGFFPARDPQREKKEGLLLREAIPYIWEQIATLLSQH